MKYVNYNDDVLKAYHYGLDNDAEFGPKVTVKKKAKIIVYYLLLIVLCRYDDRAIQKAKVVNGKKEKEINDPDDRTVLYYGIVGGILESFRNAYTNVSGMKRAKRFRILFETFFTYVKDKEIGGNYAYWLCFNYWHNFILHYNLTELMQFGQCDRLSTQLSYLARLYKIDFIIQQHGFAWFTRMNPRKMYARKVYAFDDVEIEKFKSCIVANDDCEYDIKYKCTVNFVKNELDKKYCTIGFIDQHLVKDIPILMDSLMKYCDNCKIYVMLHPRTKKQEFAKYLDKGNVTILEKDKVFGIDLLVANTSTLIFDYIQSEFEAPIIVGDLSKLFPEYKGKYENLYYSDNVEEFESILCEKITECKKSKGL